MQVAVRDMRDSSMEKTSELMLETWTGRNEKHPKQRELHGHRSQMAKCCAGPARERF